MKNFIPKLRGLNSFILRQKILDAITFKRSTIRLIYRIDIIDKNGNLKRTTGNMKSHSFVIGFLQNLYLAIAHTYGSACPIMIIKDTSGSNNQLTTGSGSNGDAIYMLATEAPNSIITYGIQVGTGTDAVTVTDYTLQTLIANGSGSGELLYSATTTTGVVANQSGICEMTIMRAIGNNSGDTITLKEMGLVMETATKYFLIARDAIDQEVLNGETALITYTLQTEI